MKLGSLFSGIGGIELGFKKVGVDCVWAIEIDAKACYTYSKNFNNKIINDDINNVNIKELEKIDILTAGFPCQAFSVAGYRKGFKDERGNIFFGILRYLDILKPQIVFLENVKNLQNHDNGNTLKTILYELEKFNYKIKYKVLNTFKYGNTPQNRERIYIVGFLDEKVYNAFEFPQEKKITKTIKNLLDNKVNNSYYYNNHKYYDILKNNIKNKETIYQWRRHYVRENKSNLCPTLTANMGTGGHNVPLILDDYGIRKLTPRECARFQGFDDSFILPEELANSTLYKQIGNSVSIGVIKNIAKKIIEAYNGTIY